MNRSNGEGKVSKLTGRFGEDGESKSPNVEETEPNRGQSKGAHYHQPPSQRPHFPFPAFPESSVQGQVGNCNETTSFWIFASPVFVLSYLL